MATGIKTAKKAADYHHGRWPIGHKRQTTCEMASDRSSADRDGDKAYGRAQIVAESAGFVQETIQEIHHLNDNPDGNAYNPCKYS